MPAECHELIITSLRDLTARCSCGGWEMLSPTSDDVPDEHLRTRARTSHRKHVLESMGRRPDVEQALGEMSRNQMKACLRDLLRVIHDDEGFDQSDILGVLECWDLPRASNRNYEE